MNNFHADLNFSHEAEDFPFWKEVYRKAFPYFQEMISYRQDGEHQRAGIDRGIYLSCAKEILIDEKVRRKDYGDIALEHISNDRTKSPGWVCKPLRADFIAYAILPTETCYLLPVPALQAAWEKNAKDWKFKADMRAEGFSTAKAPNCSYNTISCCVPVKVLFRAIGNALRIKFSHREPEYSDEPFNW